MNKHLHFT
jgi:hypothetical protein